MADLMQHLCNLMQNLCNLMRTYLTKVGRSIKGPVSGVRGPCGPSGLILEPNGL